MENYPFLYYGHGTSYFEDEFNCLIWFNEKIDKNQFEKIKLQKFLSGYISFSVSLINESIILIYLPKNCEFEIKAFYNNGFKKQLDEENEGTIDVDSWGNERKFMPSADEWAKFNEELNQFLVDLDINHKILLVLKPAVNKKKYGTFSDWHKWSIENFPEHAWPVVSSFYLTSGKNISVSESASEINILINMFTHDYIKKNKGNKKRLYSHIQMLDLLCENQIPCDNEDDLKWYYYEPMMYDIAGIFDKLLPNDLNSVGIINKLKPYTQLVVFSGCEYPYLILFDKPVEHLKLILKQLSEDKNDILCEYLSHILSTAISFMKRYTSYFNKNFINDLINLILSVKIINVQPYIQCERGWIYTEQWDSILEIMSDIKWIESYLLRHSHPVEKIQSLIEKIPDDFKSKVNDSLTQLSKQIASLAQENLKVILKTNNMETLSNEAKYGFAHNLTGISDQIKKLTIH